jgi:hypothetical protein
MNAETQALLNSFPELVETYRNSHDVKLADEFLKLYDRVTEAAITALQSA